jgi:ribonucleoside-diphosphate reductase beta chain
MMNSMSRKLTSLRGLDRESPPLRLYQKAKRLGVWDPAEIDLTRDAEEWRGLTGPERDLLLRVTALFQAGEESVVLDLLPLMLVVAREGRLEEELFLTAFLWEEGKHTEFFRRFLDEVAHEDGDLARLQTPSYRTLFYEELPAALGALLDDPSPAAQVRAVVTYTMIVEGVLAETGYHGYFTALERAGLLPGLRAGLARIKRDESRHIAYGVYLLSRLVQADPDLWPLVETRMNELLPTALGIVEETFALYDEMPFGLELDEFLGYATGQFQKRFGRIERAGTGAELELEEDEE